MSSAPPSPPPRKPLRPGWAWTVLGATLLAAFVLSVGWSTQFLSPVAVVRELLGGPMADPTPANAIVWDIRLVRACGCVMVGALLGVVGAAFQALFRNPLADPYIVGVSSGAAVGGVLAMVLGISAWLGGLGMLVVAFATGMGSLGLVVLFARRKGAVDMNTLLLAGVVVGALLSAVLSLILVVSGEDANQLLRWLLGSTTPMFWNRVALLAAALVVGGTVLFLQTRGLNAFAVGEETARRLGVDTGRLQWIVLGTGTAMTAAAVGAVGIVGFLGLVAPHLSRRLFGVDFRRSLPGSAMLGATLLLAADLVAQRGVEAVGRLLSSHGTTSLELPVGVVTALLGAPFLLVLLRRGDRS